MMMFVFALRQYKAGDGTSCMVRDYVAQGGART